VEQERALLEDELAVAEHDARDVHGEEAAALQRGGRAEGEDAAGRRQHRVEARGGEVDAVDEPHRELADDEADREADAHLQEEEHEQPRPEGHLSGEHLDQADGEEDRHRIVGAALDLERRAQPLAQVHAGRAQEREDRRGVRGADDAPEQEPLEQREIEHVHRHDPGHGRGDEDAEGGERRRGFPGELQVLERGAQPTVEEDERERDGADGVRERVVVEGDLPDAVGAGQHAQPEEEHEHRQPRARGELAREDPEGHQGPREQQQLVDQEHGAKRSSMSFRAASSRRWGAG